MPVFYFEGHSRFLTEKHLDIVTKRGIIYFNLIKQKETRMKKIFCIFFIFLLASIFTTLSYSQTPPPGQTGGGIQQQEQQIQTERKLEKQIKSKKKKAEEAVVTEKPTSAEEGQKSLVKKIDVRGVTLIPQDAVDKIIKDYEGKELTLNEMQKVCDLITDEYRKRGRVTSRAYMPPQTITAKDGILVIIVIEGKLGNVDVKDNKFFSSKLLKKKLDMKPGEYFDYQALQKALVKINEHPDRFVKAGLVPGKEAGTTDIVLEVQDRFPVHYGYEIDNFGSRYMNFYRNSFTVEDNNVTGLDDKLYVKYQKAQADFYSSPYISYTIPLYDRLEGGMYWLWSDSKLGKEFKAIDITSESSIGGGFFTYDIIDMAAVSFKLTGGFDSKSVINYTSGVKSSRDEDRVLKAGLNLDVSDKWGRTIVTLEEDVGILMDGLHAKDPLATVPGAGAEFQKLTGNLYRLQPMPFSSSILWKNAFQATHYNMLSVEQFQLGGISNVRGYSPAEYVGDQGLTSTVEWSFPPYGFPKNIKVPLSRSTVYDATRFVAFYDMGYVRINNPTGTEKQNRTLQGWGYGLRFNLPEDLFARVELAYRFDSKVEPGDANLYLDFGKKF